MYSRPLLYKGKSLINSDYILGRIVTNNFETCEDKEKSIMISLDGQYVPGYKAYIFKSIPSKIENIECIYEVDKIECFINDDIIRISKNGDIRILYRSDSEDNVIFVTNLCNSNCIMCPDSDIVRKKGENVSINELIEYVNYIPKNCKHITITGGEPGMLKKELVMLINECKEKLPNTDFLLLTNGRVLSDDLYRKDILDALPYHTRFGIPLYSSNKEIHDNITRGKDSFLQTTKAIKKLLDENIEVEIRTVILKKNYKELPKLAEYISKNFPKIEMVNFMALEVLGNCLKNKNEVWIDFEEISEDLLKASTILIKNGIKVQLYNFPLCKIDSKLVSLSSNSITDYKVRYKKECENCKAKSECGGFFFSTVNLNDIKVNPF